jgi:predicted NAD/FAD-dependent oxidoreductase
MRIAIVGAGIAGLACANLLKEGGHSISLFDKGRGAGGRMATRRTPTSLGEAAFDHGAQYFTVRDPEFRSQVASWEQGGHVARWPGAGEDSWVGVPAMNSVVKAMAADHDVYFGIKIEGVERLDAGWSLRHASGTDGPFEALVFAVPAEQAAVLLSLYDFAMASVALRARSQPCWTGMYAFADKLPVPDAPVRNQGIINWAVRNSAKPGRSGPETWVVQAQPDWSRYSLEESADTIAARLLSQLGEALGIELPAPVSAAAHRWRFAMSSGTGDGALWNPEKRIGACGDWLIAPRVECAWLSGRKLAQQILRGIDTDGIAADASQPLSRRRSVR